MKITYQDKPAIKNPTLAEIKNGDVFIVGGSPYPYMRCNMNAANHFITNNCSDTWNAIVFTGMEPFEEMSEFEEEHEYEELIVCVSLATGNIVLLYQDIEVKPLNCELVVNKD